MNVKNMVLGIGIVVVYALALWQGIQAFYPTPEWNDYCESDFRSVPFKDGVQCDYNRVVEDKAVECNSAGGWFRYEYDENGCVVDGYCDECQISYNDASDKYSRNVFIISLIVGILTFIVGFLILSVEPVGSSLLASGVWAVFYGTVWNWRNFGTGWRFGLLILVLVVLVWIALRLNRKKKSFFQKLKRR